MVASFTDAWIETTISEEEMKIAVSHLLQMRGLKPKYCMAWQGQIMVASFTDAWIETQGQLTLTGIQSSHLLQMRGLKHNNPFYYD